MGIRLLLLVALAVSVLAGLTAGVSPAVADPYFNSSEPGCNGSDPNVLWCDDFERAAWAASTNDFLPANNFGWEITTHGDVPMPPNSIICGGVGAAGSNCAATSGGKTSDGQALLEGGHQLGPNGILEAYVRYYRKHLSGFQFGYQKMFSINPFNFRTGAIWGNTNYENTPAQSTVENIRTTVYGDNNGQGTNYFYNITVGSGDWWFFEYHIKLNNPPGTANGTFRVWAKNCGPAGLCDATPPALVVNRVNNTIWRQSGDTRLGLSVYVENWGPSGVPVSTGTEYYDQIKASTVGPIGPVGTSGASNTDRQTLAVAATLTGSQPGRVIGTVLTSRPAIRSVLTVAPVGLILLLGLYVKARSRR